MIGHVIDAKPGWREHQNICVDPNRSVGTAAQVSAHKQEAGEIGHHRPSAMASFSIKRRKQVGDFIADQFMGVTMHLAPGSNAFDAPMYRARARFGVEGLEDDRAAHVLSIIWPSEA
jgi:hypothetical protein